MEAMRVAAMRFLSGRFRRKSKSEPGESRERPLYTTMSCRGMAELCRLDFRNPTPALTERFAELTDEAVALLMREHGVKTPDTARLLLAQAIAHARTPYGPGTLADIDSIYAAETLDCSNYGILAHHIAAAVLDDPTGFRFAFVGWDGGAIGNHQMVFARNLRSGENLLLDPAVGLAAFTDYDHVASGQPIDPSAILAISPTPQLQPSREHVARSLRDGAFRPSDLLYYFDGISHLLERFSSVELWPTPGAMAWRDRNHAEDHGENA
jgi:hypothetical protein